VAVAPSLGVALAVVAGGLPRLDARVDASLPGQVDAYLFGGGADGDGRDREPP
jgi:hypothetical protein